MSDSDWKIIGASIEEGQLANWSQQGLIQLPKGYQYVQAMAAFGCCCRDDVGGFGYRIACQNVSNWHFK